MQEQINELSKLYSLTDEKFEEYFRKALMILTIGKRPSQDKTLVIVGGQSGAGKTRLIPIANEELGNNAVVVDFDELRALHPNYKEVSQNYPEITHRILHPDTEKVKNRILDELIKQNYNVIYEGALRDTQGFIKFARKFKDSDYKIQMDIMAVPKLESFGSTFLRYATALVTDVTARWVEKSAHDGSYEGVLKTVEAFKKENLADSINVYVRSEESPKKIYSTTERQHQDAITAIKYGRDSGRRKAVEDFDIKYKTVETILSAREPELLGRLEDWVKLYEEEKSYLISLSKGSEYND